MNEPKFYEISTEGFEEISSRLDRMRFVMESLEHFYKVFPKPGNSRESNLIIMYRHDYERLLANQK